MWRSNAVCTIYSELRTFFKSILIILVMWPELGGSGCLRIFWEARFASSICNLLNDSKEFCSITDWCLICCSSLLILLFWQVVNLLQQVWWRLLWLQTNISLMLKALSWGNDPAMDLGIHFVEANHLWLVSWAVSVHLCRYVAFKKWWVDPVSWVTDHVKIWHSSG